MADLATLSSSYPSQGTLIATLHALLTATPPSFMHITDAHCSRLTSCALKRLLDVIALESDHKTVYASASISAVAAFTPRILFDSILNALARHSPTWDDGCANWSCTDGARYNESLDSFIWGIKDVHDYLRRNRNDAAVEVRMVLLVERAERLLPELMVALTRLAELTQTPLTTIFTSSLPWYDIKPPLGAAPDPYHLYVDPPNQKSTLQNLSTSLTEYLPSGSHYSILTRISKESIQSLQAPYISALHSVCGHFVSDPDELTYLSATLWPAFLDELARLATEGGVDYEEEEGELDITDELKLRLLKAFSPKFREALDVLYPRLGSAPASSLSSQVPSRLNLTRTEKYILIASYLASTNPTKSDMRMLYRGSEGGRRKRRKSSVLTSSRKGKDGAAIKVPQRLLGPTAFPLDRMMAILGNLMVEHEEDLDFGNEGTRERAAEVEVGRAGLLGAITTLTQAHLLTGTWPTYKCAVGYEAVLEVARDVGVSLGERIWEAP
ncbi:hypothetical protein OE88DRAFT_1750843 [Heliocybe sulcata]|uniref:Origin recognition complex subunit 5 C-terminal domain-containing protein n=1 Tax=Heliocybe sulcata TaxID=5364 RepID=A0A5C3MZQ8_9AGAM|nr:hypothetical protein OE88DRAFT_1750843 [Heliocybe sulcata]